MLGKELREFIQTEKNISMEFVKQAREHGKSVYLYGAGRFLHYAVNFMQRYKIEIKAILDTNKEGEYRSIPVIRFKDFMKTNPDQDSWFVISAPSAEMEITKILSGSFPQENIFSFIMILYCDFIPNVEDYRNYLLKHWQELSEFSEQLEDDFSRETLEAVLRGRVSGRIEFFRQCYAPAQYYPEDIIRLTKGEVMVDLGASDGDTLKEFLRHCPDFCSVYCFEPDTNCLPILNNIKKKTYGKERIHIISKGAWDCADLLEFYNDGECVGDAHIQLEHSGKPALQIETAAVDEEVSEPISFMKMDIEGAELRALYGAQRQICKNHPQLAICVYHKMDDLLNIWDYLRKMVPEYHFYLRQHNANDGTDTVLYAVTA